MKLCAFVPFLLTAAMAQTTPAGLPREIVQLSRIKKQAAAQLKRIPAFTCLANFERYRQDKAGAPMLRDDTLRADVVYADHRERFGWPGSGKIDSTLAELTGTGLSSEGEFIGFATTIFVHDNGRSTFAGEETVLGRQAIRYNYKVATMLSGYELSFPTGHARVALKGSFWADRETLDLLRLRVEADEIPPYLGVSAVVTEVDYAKTRLGSQPPVIFPQRAEVTIVSNTGTSRNEAQYTHCREFLSTSAISFEEAPETGGTPTSPAKQLPVLREGTRLRLSLQDPLTTASSLGEPLSARVETGPFAGAYVTGRVRVLERTDHGTLLAGLEFTELISDGPPLRFFATLTQVSPKFNGTVQWKGLPVLPGVVYLDCKPADVLLIPAGTWLDWQIVSISYKPRSNR